MAGHTSNGRVASRSPTRRDSRSPTRGGLSRSKSARNVGREALQQALLSLRTAKEEEEPDGTSTSFEVDFSTCDQFPQSCGASLAHDYDELQLDDLLISAPETDKVDEAVTQERRKRLEMMRQQHHHQSLRSLDLESVLSQDDATARTNGSQSSFTGSLKFLGGLLEFNSNSESQIGAGSLDELQAGSSHSKGGNGKHQSMMSLFRKASSFKLNKHNSGKGLSGCQGIEAEAEEAKKSIGTDEAGTKASSSSSAHSPKPSKPRLTTAANALSPMRRTQRVARADRLLMQGELLKGRDHHPVHQRDSNPQSRTRAVARPLLQRSRSGDTPRRPRRPLALERSQSADLPIRPRPCRRNHTGASTQVGSTTGRQQRPRRTTRSGSSSPHRNRACATGTGPAYRRAGSHGDVPRRPAKGGREERSKTPTRDDEDPNKQRPQARARAKSQDKIQF